MRTNYKRIFIIMLIKLAFLHVNAQPVITWEEQFNGVNSMSDKATAIAIDNNCNVYVTGQSEKSGSGINYVTIKYDAVGNTIWTAEYDGPNNLDDRPMAIKVDANSNVYVTGKSASASGGFDFLTIKYNSSGTQQWASRYNSTANADDVANDLAIDGSGNVYVCGNQGTGSALIKYNSSGNMVWIKTFEQSNYDYSNFIKILISNSGSIEVLAEIGSTPPYPGLITLSPKMWHFDPSDGANTSSNWGYSVWADRLVPVDFVLNSAGDAIICGYSLKLSGDNEKIRIVSTNNLLGFLASYMPSGTVDSRPSKIKLDNSGNIYITGFTDIDASATENYNFLALKYNSNGVQQWIKTFGDTGDDIAQDMSLGSGSAPDIYVTGYVTNTQGDKDIKTIKYNNNGTLQTAWTQTYDGGTNIDAVPIGIKTDAFNNVIIAGHSGQLNAEDYTTIKYISNSFTPVITWTSLNTYTATTGTGYQWYHNNVPVNGANQQSLNITETGNGDYYCMVSQYCYTYKSNIATNATVGLNQYPDSDSFTVFPNPNVGVFTLSYQLKPNCAGSIEVFNMTGSCIYKKELPVGSTEQKIELPNTPIGIYNCVFSSDNIRIAVKLAIQKN